MKVLIDIPKEEYKHILQQDVFNTYEQGIIQNGKVLEGTTNGDMIKAMFPNAQIDYHEKSDLVDDYVTVFIKGCDTCQDYSYDWWNAPYEGGEDIMSKETTCENCIYANECIMYEPKMKRCKDYKESEG